MYENKEYRIFYLAERETGLCLMNSTSLEVNYVNTDDLISLLQNGTATYKSDDNKIVADQDSMTENTKSMFIRKKSAMQEIVEVYGPTFKLLVKKGGAEKPELIKIAKKYNLSLTQIRRMVTPYLQSGLKDSSLVTINRKKGVERNYKNRPGRKAKYSTENQIILDDDVKRMFEENLQYYFAHRASSLKSVYDKMMLENYSEKKVIDGVLTYGLLPKNQRPTIRQFRYYCKIHSTPEERKISRTSFAETRNANRILLGKSATNVVKPGEMAEMDAVEFDISLVAELDPSQTIGRPIIYALIDVYSRMILAVGIAFDNNSNIGLTNLFLNLADDKQKYAKKYGIIFDNPAIWPSGYKPSNVRCDRGSDFKSHDFGRICNELNIERTLVTGATGSLKGIIEQYFHQLHRAVNPHTENYGLIEKRYDSNHHEEATINIAVFTKMIIQCVLAHNTTHMDNYDLSPEMVTEKIDARPYILWQYGCEKYGQPKIITDKTNYLWTMMMTGVARISKKGILFKHIPYLPSGTEYLIHKMFSLQNKKEPLPVRYDPRDVSHIYCAIENKLYALEINQNTKWGGGLVGKTFKEANDLWELKRTLDENAVQNDEVIATGTYQVLQNAIEQNIRPTYASKENMREAREKEKQAVTSSNTIMSRLLDSKQSKLSTIENQEHAKEQLENEKVEEANNSVLSQETLSTATPVTAEAQEMASAPKRKVNSSKSKKSSSISNNHKNKKAKKLTAEEYAELLNDSLSE